MQPQSEEKSRASSLNAAGIRMTDAGRFAEAIAAFSEALALAPGMAGVYFNRAEARRQTGDAEGARRDLLEALKLAPDEPDFSHALGLLSYEEDDFPAATELYLKAIGLRPDFAQAWNDLGVVHFRKSEYAEARGCFEKATAIEPSSPEAWFNLADTYDELGLVPERAAALEALRKADMLSAYRESGN